MIQVPPGSCLVQHLRCGCHFHELETCAPLSAFAPTPRYVRLGPPFECLMEVRGPNASALKDQGESPHHRLVPCISLPQVANRGAPL